MTNTALPEKDNIPLAVGVIVCAVLALSLGDALIKMTSANFVIWQIFVLRSLLVIPFLTAFIAIRTPGALRRPAAVWWTILRSLLLVLMWVCYYLSLPHLPLSAAAAAFYTLPIFITLFSAAFTGARITKGGWIAVFLGFAGVCLILRPKAGDFNLYAILPLFSAMLYAFAMILTRTKCRLENPAVLSLALNVAFVVVGGVAAGVLSTLPDTARAGFLLAPWTQMGGMEWTAMSLLALAILIGSLGAAIAYQIGPPAMIGTFDFTYVGFAVLWSVVFFGDIPDAVSVLGMAMIVAAGLIAIRQ